jgi:hypothetical protein
MPFLTKPTFFCFSCNNIVGYITYTEIDIKQKLMKKLFIPILMVASLIGTSISAKAQTADEIVDKYIAAIGGKDNWKKVQSMKVEGAIQVQGLEIPYTVNAVHMKGSRMQGEFQGNVFIEITTPTKGWSQNPMAGKATLQPVDEDELKTKVDDLDIQKDLPLNLWVRMKKTVTNILKLS